MGAAIPLLFLNLSFFVIYVVSTDTIILDDQSRTLHRLPLTSVVGPETIAFDAALRGPYTGVSDGRVLRWDTHLQRWAQFAVPPRRRGITAAMCNGVSDPDMEPKCGRPLGLQFHRSSGYLYIADAYHGLLRVGPRGGLAAVVATTAEGVPFNMTNGVDVDQDTGMVYFTDSSTDYQRNQWLWAVLMGDATGRFMRFDPKMKQVKVLLEGLQFPNGVAMSADNSFVLVAESTRHRVLRYWIKGPKIGTTDVFANVTGFPDNIKRTSKGEFWVGINTGKGKIQSSENILHPNGDQQGDDDIAAMKFDEEGRLVGTLSDRRSGNDALSEVEERNGALYLGSVVAPYVGIFGLLS